MIEERVCKDWLDVHRQLYAESWNDVLSRHRSRFAFRGMPSKDFTLETTLQRMGGPYDKVETHLARNFIKYAYEHVAATNPGVVFNPKGNSLWNWLVIARHHGLPTRILDWTYSPYVALHFATEDMYLLQKPVDSVIWCIDYRRAQKMLPSWLQEVLEMQEADVFTVDMLGEVAHDILTFEEKIAQNRKKNERDDFVIFFEPPSLDSRVVNQFALHSVMSHATLCLDSWLERHEDLCYKIIIPADLKWEVRDKLDQANINERMLYPGLDGLCMWLRRYYGPTPMLH